MPEIVKSVSNFDNPDLFQAQLAAFALAARTGGVKYEADVVYGNFTDILTDEYSLPDDTYYQLLDFTHYNKNSREERSIHSRKELIGAFATDYAGIQLDSSNLLSKAGGEAVVYRTDDVVIKDYNECDSGIVAYYGSITELIDHKVAAFLRVKEERGFEQIRGLSYIDNKLACSFVRGNTIEWHRRNGVARLACPDGDAKNFVQEKYIKKKAKKLCINRDIHNDNIMYHEEDGYTLIDYELCI